MLRGADALRLEKDGDQWRVAAPAELPERFVLDQTQVESLVGAFSNLRAAEFADNTTPEEVGLATPPLVITATTVSGPARLEMGDTADKQTFVKRGDGTQIYKIASYAHDRLDKSLDDLRDMRLMRYDVADATRLSITEGDRRLVFEKDGDWKMTESNGESVDGFVLDPKKVDTALRAKASLLGIEIESFGIRDIVLPGEMDGVKLAELFTAVRPEAKIIFMSGYPGIQSQDGLVKLPENSHFIAKPLHYESLAEIIFKTLSQKDASNDDSLAGTDVLHQNSVAIAVRQQGG